MKRCFIVIVMLVIGCISFANDQQIQPVTVSDVKALTKAGLSDEIIISQIRNTTTIYHLNTADIIDLKNSKVSEKIIDFMINTATPIQSTQAGTQTQTGEVARVVEVSPPVIASESVIVAPAPYIWVDDLWFWDGYYWGRHPTYWNRPFPPPAHINPGLVNPPHVN